jgi:hypothetical protein
MINRPLLTELAFPHRVYSILQTGRPYRGFSDVNAGPVVGARIVNTILCMISLVEELFILVPIQQDE